MRKFYRPHSSLSVTEHPGILRCNSCQKTVGVRPGCSVLGAYRKIKIQSEDDCETVDEETVEYLNLHNLRDSIERQFEVLEQSFGGRAQRSDSGVVVETGRIFKRGKSVLRTVSVVPLKAPDLSESQDSGNAESSSNCSHYSVEVISPAIPQRDPIGAQPKIIVCRKQSDTANTTLTVNRTHSSSLDSWTTLDATTLADAPTTTEPLQTEDEDTKLNPKILELENQAIESVENLEIEPLTSVPEPLPEKLTLGARRKSNPEIDVAPPGPKRNRSLVQRWIDSATSGIVTESTGLSSGTDKFSEEGFSEDNSADLATGSESDSLERTTSFESTSSARNVKRKCLRRKSWLRFRGFGGRGMCRKGSIFRRGKKDKDRRNTGKMRQKKGGFNRLHRRQSKIGQLMKSMFISVGVDTGSNGS